MLLKEIMQKKVVTLSPDATIRDAAKKMKDYRIGYLLITNGDNIKGCVTDRDLVIWLANGKNADDTRLDSIMQTNVITAGPDSDVFEASRLMARKKVRRLPVTDDGRILGIVSVADLATVLEEEVDNFFHVEEAHQL